jgi:hypothetical protein
MAQDPSSVDPSRILDRRVRASILELIFFDPAR